MHTVALIVAAGAGTRLGGVPKQYRELAGEPVLRRTIEAFTAHPEIGGVKVVIDPDHTSLYEQVVEGLILLPPALGGETRQQSVRNGLEALLVENAPANVLIHDAARPFVSVQLIEQVLQGLKQHSAVLPVVPIADSLRQIEGNTMGESLDRESVRAAQTPQGFHFQSILDAHRLLSGTRETDDAALAKAAGLAVHVIEGEEANFKITTDADWFRAQRQVGPGSGLSVTGSGFDVHRLGDGDGVYLCGAFIEHDRSLVGHSDADVGLHAITDAILGAAGAGDIGEHFPPSDAQWKGASSRVFVEKAVELLSAAGGTLVHLDITLICEAPKIGPHKARMKDMLSQITGLPAARINIKATTTEGLGFTGREEGIAAQAVASAILTV